jgi:hypothetical protein
MLHDRLNFKIYPFQRTSWASEQLKITWEKTLSDIADKLNQWLMVREVFDIQPLQLRTFPRAAYYAFKKSLQRDGLYVDVAHDVPRGIKLAFGIITEHEVLAVIGQRNDVLAFLHSSWELATVAAVSKIPLSHLQFWSNYAEANLEDHLWAYFAHGEGWVTQKHLELPGSLVNPLWRRSGIHAMPYLPSSVTCKESSKLAGHIQTIFRQQVKDRDLIERWQEILSWPCEWSALHGIAEIKTPLFKMIYNTDATGDKYVFRLLSENYPAEGLPGVQFPYRKPSKLHFTDSVRTHRGNEHLEKTLRN